MNEMNVPERLNKVFNFEKPDRLPVIEWATWWDKTLDRWRTEGLPATGSTTDIMEYFGLDIIKQFWLPVLKRNCPSPTAHGAPLLENFTLEAYKQLKPYLYPEDAVTRHMAELHKWKQKQENGSAAVWLTLEGFFWFPRRLYGIEGHLYGFYDTPNLMHEINSDILAFNTRLLYEFCNVIKPDFITFAEDMSYNNGSMISRALFNEFIAPYYREIMPKINALGIPVIIDSDGNIEGLLQWFDDIGANGFLPLERQAGTDISEIRKKFPHVILVGGFDKMVMHSGEEAMRNEFERLLPVMKQGGFIPSCDHQTPPRVSMSDYRLYVSLLKEYCLRACE